MKTKRKYHHSTATEMICCICGKPIMQYWKDAEEKNGFSDLIKEYKTSVAHWECTGGKSLQQLNEERKLHS